MRAPAQKNIEYYPCCPGVPYADVTFNLTLRRKTLYYTTTLIIPCVSINMVTMVAFYVPSESAQKVSIAISILLSLSMFQMLLMDMVPATSLTVPILGRYLLFTNIIVTVSVFFSVVVKNMGCRTHSTYGLHPKLRKSLLHTIPRLLLMRPPRIDNLYSENNRSRWESCEQEHTDLSEYANPYKEKFNPIFKQDNPRSLSTSFIGLDVANLDIEEFCRSCTRKQHSQYPPNVIKALEGAMFIAKHMSDQDESVRVR